jgi:hypothetical protein
MLSGLATRLNFGTLGCLLPGRNFAYLNFGSWPTAPIRGPISRRRRHPANLDPLLPSTNGCFRGAQLLCGGLKPPLLRQIHLPQKRLVAGIAFEVLEERVTLYGIQIFIPRRVGSVQPLEGAITFAAKGINAGYL